MRTLGLGREEDDMVVGTLAKTEERDRAALGGLVGDGESTA